MEAGVDRSSSGTARLCLPRFDFSFQLSEFQLFSVKHEAFESVGNKFKK
jgi:hypothetical protein